MIAPRPRPDLWTVVWVRGDRVRPAGIRPVRATYGECFDIATGLNLEVASYSTERAEVRPLGPIEVKG